MEKKRVDEINDFMLDAFKEENIEDTTENRLAFLEAVQEAWREDDGDSLEKSLYQVALSGEIMILKLRTMFEVMKR
jgi:hypothetical protein